MQMWPREAGSKSKDSQNKMPNLTELKSSLVENLLFGPLDRLFFPLPQLYNGWFIYLFNLPAWIMLRL